jgi:hypothetical protein
LSKEKLDHLYSIFVKNDFDRVKTYEEQVYDRGGETIFLRWSNGKFASVSNSGMTFVEESWRGEWNACLSELKEIIENETDKQKKEYELKFDKLLFEKKLSAYVDNEAIFPSELKQPVDEFLIKTVRLIPGKHRMSISRDKLYSSIEINSDSTKGIYMFMKNDSLQYEFIK